MTKNKMNEFHVAKISGSRALCRVTTLNRERLLDKLPFIAFKFTHNSLGAYHEEALRSITVNLET